MSWPVAGAETAACCPKAANQTAPKLMGATQMIDVLRRFAWARIVVIIAYSLTSVATTLAQECKNRGQLDALYCDENNDLVADVPTDPKKLRDPFDLVLCPYPSRASFGLSESVQTVHRLSRSMHVVIRLESSIKGTVLRRGFSRLAGPGWFSSGRF